jgi:hypothetical protein
VGLHTIPGMDSYYEPDDGPELPDGWWDEDTVDQVQEAVRRLVGETLYEGGQMANGISVRFVARLSMLQNAVGLMPDDNPLVIEATAMFRDE